jgi:hypothetical protein
MNVSVLDLMVEGYVECALWAGLVWPEDGGEPWGSLSDYHEASDIEHSSLITIRDECRQFYLDNAEDLAEMDPAQVGHVFYLTRNHHGTGFWDRGLGERGARLTSAAHAFGESELLESDDGRLYVL